MSREYATLSVPTRRDLAGAAVPEAVRRAEVWADRDDDEEHETESGFRRDGREIMREGAVARRDEVLHAADVVYPQPASAL